MTKILKPDQHLASYIYQKSVDPDSRIVVRSYRRNVVEAIDAIVELAHGERDVVKSQSDWTVFEELLRFFASEWPNEFQQFKESIDLIRSTRNSGGYSQSKEIKYVGAFPPRFERMIRVIFPAQQFDKKFVNTIVRKFPLFKVGGEGN